MVSIVSISNNGDGTYNVEFSEAVAWNNDTTPDAAYALYSSDGLGWGWCSNVSQVNATTIQINPANNTGSGQLFMLTFQPAYLTAAKMFEIAAPVQNIP